MRTATKIILILIGLFVLAFIVALLREVGGQGKNGGIIGMILIIAFLAGARAIWKYNPEKNKNDNDKHELDKK